MPELTREEKLKLVEKLPQQLQDLLYSEDTGAFLLYLGQKYNLPDEKVSQLSKLVADVVLRITPITSLAQEINSKITSDAQVAMNLAQELYAELLAVPVPNLPSVETKPLVPNVPNGVDRYREPTIGPEVIDLRKAPPPTPTAPSRPIMPPTPITPTPPAPKPISPPLTFTRPIEPSKPAPTTPLIEAEPHKIPSSVPRPQYIIRPSGLPPTDRPENVLDLRKDKGEF